MDHDVSAGLDHAEAETAARSAIRNPASGTPLPAQIGPYHIFELLGQGPCSALARPEVENPTVGVDTSNLAECLMDMNRYAEAEPLLVEAERLLTAASGESHPRVAKTRRRLARLYRALDRPDLVAKYEHP